MRHLVQRAAIGGMGALALLLAGCGKKAPEATANVAVDSGSAAPDLENGTASDITATDATIGAASNMDVLPPAPEETREKPSARAAPKRSAEDEMPSAEPAGGNGD